MPRRSRFAGRVRRSKPAAGDDAVLVQRIATVRGAYRDALDDDLNLPQGIGLVFELIREANAALDEGRVGESAHAGLLALIGEVDAHVDVMGADESGLADEIERLIAEREAARAARDFARADRLRDELRERGIALEDSKEGVRWKRLRVGTE
jgi:cysteinyl-tRNA synthetase